MKIKHTFAAIAIMVSAGAFGVANAEVLDVKVKPNVNANIQASTTVNANMQNKSTTTNSNTSANTNTNANAKVDADADADAKIKVTAESHRSTIATFVKSLLSVADRDGGIGSQVRVVANSQNDSASTTAAAMAKVEKRGSLRTFFFGSDYKNIGVIRSELSTTTNNIVRLKNLLNLTSDASVRADINNQITALELIQAKIEAFLELNESKFSLFGWLNKSEK